MTTETRSTQQVAGQGCPFMAARQTKPVLAPNGCPVSQAAQDFNPFHSDYMQNPAAFLASFREDEPVFYNPELDYWVVTRYADVKEVFRNSAVFSPANALEKITP